MDALRIFKNKPKAIAILLIIFLTFLGMWNPWHDSTPRPKKNPRAVLSSLGTKSLTLASKISDSRPKTSTGAVALTTAIIPLWRNTPLIQAVFHDLYVVLTSPCSSFLSSRAPPFTIL